MSSAVPRFIALPVGQGDAFYLKTPSGSVLVDGGRGIARFPALFMQTTRAHGADILVCTHNDADHTNGIIGFLDAGLECREIWLPGRWLRVLPHALNPNPEVAEALAEQALQAARALRNYSVIVTDEESPFEIYGERASEQPERYAEGISREPQRYCEESRSSESYRDDSKDGWPSELARDLEGGPLPKWDNFVAPFPWFFDWPPYPWARYGWPILRQVYNDPIVWRLYFGAVEAAERIRRIAQLAYHRGVAVRWFQYTKACPQGGTRWLRPLNGREVAYVTPARIEGLLFELALTTANRESLVFWADLDDCPGVLFSADSDLSDIAQLPNLSGAIITAPHHGSEANANAYSKVRQYFGGSKARVTWIRSDGRFRSRPGSAYLSAPGRRICTICRSDYPQPKQAAKLSMRFWKTWNRWVREAHVRLCSCH
jgi:hypothetical protein